MAARAEVSNSMDLVGRGVEEATNPLEDTLLETKSSFELETPLNVGSGGLIYTWSLCYWWNFLLKRAQSYCDWTQVREGVEDLPEWGIVMRGVALQTWPVSGPVRRATGELAPVLGVWSPGSPLSAPLTGQTPSDL